jgi:hypothetical protein
MPMQQRQQQQRNRHNLELMEAVEQPRLKKFHY